MSESSQSTNVSFKKGENFLIMTTLICRSHHTPMYIAIAMPNGRLN